MTVPNKTEKDYPHIQGLDTLRFICAIWVTLNHVGFGEVPLKREILSEWLLRVFLGSLFNSPAAVIVFFVISGFCIHYPYSREGNPNLLSYFLRRIFRILPPLIAIAWVGHGVGLPMTLLSQGILWSVVCELIYYLLYPAIRRAKKTMGWESLIGISFTGAIGVILSREHLLNYPDSVFTDWLLGLPCWLLGCLLAETWRQMPKVERKDVWGWRLLVWGISSITVFYRFHFSFGYPITLTLFSTLVYFWLKREISYFQNHRIIPFLEKLGRASFSLYLCHYPASILPEMIFELSTPHPIWIHYIFVGLVTAAFYFLIERPSHLFARWVSRKVENRNQWPSGIQNEQAA